MDELLDQPFRPSPDAFFNAVGDETVLLHVRSGAYYGIDAVGTTIWNGLGEGQALRDICTEIARKFDQPEDKVAEDVRRFIADLKEHELVVAA